MDHKRTALDQLVGQKVGLGGVTDTRFKLFMTPKAALVFEAVEDPDDGYRSCLGAINLANEDGCTFMDRPIVWVTVREASDIDGWAFVDENGHAWLTIGTDHSDSYYPCFIFRYEPAVIQTTTACPHCGR